MKPTGTAGGMPMAETMYFDRKVLGVPMSSRQAMDAAERTFGHLENVAINAWPKGRKRSHVQDLLRELRDAHFKAVANADAYVRLTERRLHPPVQTHPLDALDEDAPSFMETVARRFTNALGDLRQMIHFADQSERGHLDSMLEDLRIWHRVAVAKRISEGLARISDHDEDRGR